MSRRVGTAVNVAVHQHDRFMVCICSDMHTVRCPTVITLTAMWHLLSLGGQDTMHGKRGGKTTRAHCVATPRVYETVFNQGQL